MRGSSPRMTLNLLRRLRSRFLIHLGNSASQRFAPGGAHPLVTSPSWALLGTRGRGAPRGRRRIFVGTRLRSRVPCALRRSPAAISVPGTDPPGARGLARYVPRGPPALHARVMRFPAGAAPCSHQQTAVMTGALVKQGEVCLYQVFVFVNTRYSHFAMDRGQIAAAYSFLPFSQSAPLA